MSFLARAIGLATVATAAFAAAPAARAADPLIGAAPMAPIAEPMEEERVTFASNWYLRGDFAIAKDVQIGIGSAFLPNGRSFPNAWSIGLGMGYKFNNWLRGDLTADWRAPRTLNQNTSAMSCTTGWVAVRDPNTGVITGETPVTDTCLDYYRTRVNNTTLLANLYLDLGTWWGLTPYVGAGVGMNYVYQKTTQNWYMSNGLPYNVTTPDAINPARIWYYNWDNARSHSSMQFAYAFMAGASYAVTDHLAVDIGGRYLNMGKIESYSVATGTIWKTNDAKELRIGFRYTPD
ncbi:MAG: outer membrane protein [Rhodoblastus sp.]